MNNDGFKNINPLAMHGWGGNLLDDDDNLGIGFVRAGMGKSFRPEPVWNPNSTANKDPGYIRLFSMLTYMRPHCSKEEGEFVEEFIVGKYKPLTRFLDPDTKQIIAYGIEVKTADGKESDTLFSSHVDTVHSVGGRQIPQYKDGWLYKTDYRCLGADDGAGVWLLLEMIDRKIPGYYLFHRGEERGGIGSKEMSISHKDFLKRFKRAIAFDRRSTHSVITKQGGKRTASDKFATSLAEKFNAVMPLDFAFFSPDPGGSFTDTKNYVAIIDDCTNVSVGYEHEHSSDERLNVDYLIALRDACAVIDWSSIETEKFEREPVFSGYTPPMRSLSSVRQGSYPDYDSLSFDRSRSKGKTASDDTVAAMISMGVLSYNLLKSAPLGVILQWVKRADSRDVAETITTLLWTITRKEGELKDEQKKISKPPRQGKRGGGNNQKGTTLGSKGDGGGVVVTLPDEKDIPEFAFSTAGGIQHSIDLEAGLTGGVDTTGR